MKQDSILYQKGKLCTATCRVGDDPGKEVRTAMVEWFEKFSLNFSIPFLIHVNLKIILYKLRQKNTKRDNNKPAKFCKPFHDTWPDGPLIGCNYILNTIMAQTVNEQIFILWSTLSLHWMQPSNPPKSGYNVPNLLASRMLVTSNQMLLIRSGPFVNFDF